MIEKSVSQYKIFQIKLSQNNQILSQLNKKQNRNLHDCTCIHNTAKFYGHVIAFSEICCKLSDFVEWFKGSKQKPSLTSQVLNASPKLVGKKTSNLKRSSKRKAKIENNVNHLVYNERSMPHFNFKSLGYFPAASQVTHVTFAEAVQTNGIINGFFSQQASIGKSVLNTFFITILHCRNCTNMFKMGQRYHHFQVLCVQWKNPESQTIAQKDFLH